MNGFMGRRGRRWGYDISRPYASRLGNWVVAIGIWAVLAAVFYVVSHPQLLRGPEQQLAAPRARPQPEPSMLPLVVKKIHDGDTITADIDLPLGLVLSARSIRADGYDAWEVTRQRQTVGKITDAEISKGKAARDALASQIARFGLWGQQSDDWDKEPHGRTLLKLWSKTDKGEWLEIGPWMEAGGHTRTPPRGDGL